MGSDKRRVGIPLGRVVLSEQTSLPMRRGIPVPPTFRHIIRTKVQRSGGELSMTEATRGLSWCSEAAVYEGGQGMQSGREETIRKIQHTHRAAATRINTYLTSFFQAG